MARWILSLLLVQAAALAALAKPVTFTFHDGAAAAAAGPVSFHGQRVLRCESRLSRDEVEALEADPALDLWAVKPDHFDVRLISEAHASAAILDGARCSTWIDDVQDAVDAAAQPADSSELLALLGDEAYTLDPFFSEFQNYEAHVAQLQKYATNFPTLATLITTIGKSIEGRDLVAIRITGSKAVSATKKAFWVNGGQHAREWASPAATAYIADTLLNGYGSDAEITKILDNFVIYVLTVQNPDGYSYTFKTNRLWRKNRRLVSGSTYGVDLNRNWDDHWGQGGSSTSPSAEDYRGSAAASEPEVSNLQKYILTVPNRFAGIDFHAYGELVLRNFGWTTKAGSDEARLVKISNGIVQAIKDQSGRKYTGERASELYVTTGSTDDWLTDAAGMEGWTIELGTTFTEPVSKLVPIAQQAWAGLKYYLLEILAR